MKKGKFEITLCFYAVLAFILAFVGMSTPLMLLLGFVIVTEKDEWLTKQVLQATLLSFICSFAYSVLNIIPYINGIVNGITTFLECVISIISLVFAIIGIVNVSKEKDANIPVLNDIAEWAFGKIPEKKTYQQPVNNMPYPGQAPMQNNGMNGQAMNYQQYQQPANNTTYPGQAPMQNNGMNGQNMNYQQYQQPVNNMSYSNQTPEQNVANDKNVTNNSTNM